MRKIIGTIFILTALLLLAGCGSTATTAPPEEVRQASAEQAAPTATSLPAPTSTPDPAPTPTELPAAAEQSGEPDAGQDTVPDVPKAPFFADAVFFGNSLVDGLHTYGGMEECGFYAGVSASVISVTTIRDCKFADGTPATMLDALLEAPHGKIFMMLGINELGFTVEGFSDLYAELLDTVAQAEPDAEIYLLSLTPITEKRSLSADLFTKEKVLRFNAAIRDMAEEKDLPYVDLYTPFVDENGWLPESASTDGVHFTPEGYARWAAYLREIFPD